MPCAIFAREHEARAKDQEQLEWLTARWHLGA
jgi:hypothetical protein